MGYRIKLEKENFKFSCSHFTILGPSRAERLHGHNYYVSVEFELAQIDDSLGMAFDFNVVKPLVREITESLDEYVLLPLHSPHLKIESNATAVRARLGAKNYEFPAEDVRLLETVNVSSEELARLISARLHARLLGVAGLKGMVAGLSIEVQETRGQSVIFDQRI